MDTSFGPTTYADELDASAVLIAMTISETLAAYLIAATVFSVTPGLDTALVFRVNMAEGHRSALSAGLGVCTGLLLWGAAVAVGVVGLLAASTVAYTVLKWVGAAYLTWLGFKLIFKPRGQALNVAEPTPRRGARGWYLKGLLSNFLNPKVGVFYVSFLPQFVPHGVAVGPWTFMLGAIHSFVTVLWFAVLVLASAPLGQSLRRPQVVCWLDRVTGGVFVLFGAKLALERR